MSTPLHGTAPRRTNGGSDSPRWRWCDHRRGEPAEPLVRAWLSSEWSLAPDAIPLGRDARGRPRLGGGLSSRDVSWSHSGEGLLMAWGEAVDLGVDLEQARPRPRALELAERFFHTAEHDWLRSLPEPDRNEAFLRLWCAKEAVVKAHGRGIAFGLDRFGLGDLDGGLGMVHADDALGGPWSVHEWAPQPGYRAAIAWRGR
ncbi:4'-phosphopantetheinyl transferase superfamily protein [Lysobacter sp. KIS68-7]|uniref:4'-phosphopantetheinyl transferase family protein n=1 Tax=Lysobacter sp. KIS68-7 TaxID=2904252 RepID=UPI001E6348CB|nr:4'-phosphopantetheinyl transferase superfamily protein [Lysobacter sp. KIS68-7]UHQ20377.1 4'-phosphopantetheinyl transferase superfamily protein [Lysobacter sp. KIS68-7]